MEDIKLKKSRNSGECNRVGCLEMERWSRCVKIFFKKKKRGREASCRKARTAWSRLAISGDMFFFVTLGGGDEGGVGGDYWHLVFKGQGCCQTSGCTGQSSQWRIFWPQIPIVQRLRDPALDEYNRSPKSWIMEKSHPFLVINFCLHFF